MGASAWIRSCSHPQELEEGLYLSGGRCREHHQRMAQLEVLSDGHADLAPHRREVAGLREDAEAYGRTPAIL